MDGGRCSMSHREMWRGQAAKALVIMAAIFWFWYGVSLAQITEEGLRLSLWRILAPDGILALTSLVAGHSALVGGALFLAEGMTILAYAIWSCARGDISAIRLEVMAVTLSFPLLGAGYLWLALWSGSRSGKKEARRHE